MNKIMTLLIFCLMVKVSCASLPQRAYLEDEQNTIDIYKRIGPYVVNVHRMQKVMSNLMEVFEVPRGMGSGFIWDLKGHIVTNYHVVASRNTKAPSIVISLDHNTAIRADIVGVEPRKDIAVLRLRDPSAIGKLAVKSKLPVADSSKLHVGEKAIAIGNPFGLSRTLTTGVISALGREVPGVGDVKIRDMIQTDTSINRGHSGGVLLNSNGELIGMNTTIFSQTGGSIGIGFAVPSNDISRTVNQILKHGRVILAGIGFIRLDDGIARQLGVKGIIVGRLNPGAPAEKAGLRGTTRDSLGRIKLGDVIVAINGQSIKNYEEMYYIMENIRVGEEIVLTYLRNKKEFKVKIKTIDVNTLE